ncbi:DUF4136 domain-containing protein [Cupriavidus sp. 2TAF22]|uniref:DUF4136 domain-containing protein n=1 Tax=unclassified Cupriavidus TaxID=2640874 RepID=UPI003F8E702F
MAGAALLGAALLSGCASTVTTEVTAFRQGNWQNDPPRTYAFDRAPGQEAQLEDQTYEQWLAQALSGVGFEQVARAQARYLVRMDYDTNSRLMRVQETTYSDPWYPGPYGPYWGPYYRPWGPWGWGGPGYWPPTTTIRDVPVTLSTLRVMFKEAASGTKVYQVTAHHRGEETSLQAAMPYLIRSAFVQFPAENGRPKRVTLPLDPNDK